MKQDMLGQGDDMERAVWLLQNWYSSIINTHKGQALTHICYIATFTQPQ